MDPGVLSLFQNPAGDNTITALAENVAVATHLPNAVAGDACNGIDRVEAAAFQGCQLQVLAPADDVAAVDMTTRAML